MVKNADTLPAGFLPVLHMILKTKLLTSQLESVRVCTSPLLGVNTINSCKWTLLFYQRKFRQTD